MAITFDGQNDKITTSSQSLTVPSNVAGTFQAGGLAIGVGGTVLTTNISGLIGIGTANPTSVLTVSGDVSASTVKTNAIQTVAGKPILNSTGSIINVTELRNSTETAVSGSANGVLWTTSVTKLSNSSSSNLVVHAQLNGRGGSSGLCGTYLEVAGVRDYGFVYEYSAWGNQEMPIWGMGIWTGLSAGSITITAGWSPNNGGTGENPFQFFNPIAGRSDARGRATNSKIIVYEVVI